MINPQISMKCTTLSKNSPKSRLCKRVFMYNSELEHYMLHLSGERLRIFVFAESADLRFAALTCGLEICVQKSPPCNVLKGCSMLHIDKFVQVVVANEIIFINTYDNN